MKTQIVESTGAAVRRHSSVDETLKKFFAQKSLLQRLEPVLADLFETIIEPLPPQVQRGVLPAYCRNILQVIRKTYFKALPNDGIQRCATLDWNVLDQVIGVGMNCLRFGESHLESVLIPEGLDTLSPDEVRDLVRMVFPTFGQSENQSELWPQMPDTTVQDMMANQFAASSSVLWENFALFNQWACQFGPSAMSAFSAGIAKGMTSFIDESGQFVGETERANIYWFLLIAWPEIQVMQQAKPPKTRNDFDQWLRPFVECGLVSISSFSQLLDVCDDIGLTFKGRGAPRKK